MIIGICGQAQHGKSTLSKMLQRNFDTEVISMASPIKDMCKALGLMDEQLYGNAKEIPDPRFGNKTPRFIMQTLGTEWGRNMITPDIWSSAWKVKAQRSLLTYSTVICDDVRFPNEIKTIQEMDGVLIAVFRPGVENTQISNHESESLDFEALGIPIIMNDGTVEELYEKAKYAIHCQCR